MYKILFYVDAENITFEQFKAYWDEAMALQPFYEIIGKFYGSKDLLGGTVKKYLKLGLEYCETSVLGQGSHKNLADMKLISDCMHDVFHTYDNEVAQVYLLSRDYDFLPTVYKLKSAGLDLVTLVLDCRGESRTAKTIMAYLHNVGFLPCDDERLFNNVFENIKNAVKDVYAERTIDEFIAERTTLFMFAVRREGYDIQPLCDMKARDISFPSIIAALGETDKNRIAHLLMLFSQRYYGAALPKRRNLELIGRWDFEFL